MASQKQVLIVLSDQEIERLLEKQILSPEEFQVTVNHTCVEAEQSANILRPDLMILGDNLADGDFLNLAKKLIDNQPTLPIIMITSPDNKVLPRMAMQLGLVDWLSPPFKEKEVIEAVNRGLQRSKHWQAWLQCESHRYTGQLQQQVGEMAALAKAGRAVTSKLDLDSVLTSVVEAAVDLTSADSGSLLLLDDESGELFMRAARNFQEDFVRTFRLPVDDTLAGEVIKTGKPLLIDTNDPQKIMTSYLVSSLIYVPLTLHGKVIGVLGVDNKLSGKTINSRFVSLLSAMAEYAVVAIDNAQLYAQTEIERHKLEQILTRVRDGVVVYNADGVILLINQTVRKAFELGEEKLTGKNIEKVFKDRELLGAIKGGVTDLVGVETEGKDGHVYNVNVTTVPEVGTVSTLRDISYLKELDNLKNDFITTVSHDLRSPLTSILGYVDLIERSGEVNKQQAEFIQRVKMSAHSITDLINDLLNLGRIEGSFKENIQPVSIASIMQQSLEDHISQFENHEQSVSIDISKNLPLVNGDPLQLRQMIDNLLGNAVKYTPSKGKIHVVAKQEDDQVVIQVTDSGPGIPLEEQTKIFEKFYRAKNVDEKIPGTGLGLAITKSIVENHRGRIWVKSEVGKGSTFSVVLPIAISK